jgi:ferredoxin
MSWSRVRRVVQVLVLITYLALTLAALGWGADWMPGTIFSRLDPLVGLSSMIASRTFIAFWAAAGITIALSVVFGRAWCGWVCPVGALIDLMPARRRKGDKRLSRGWQLGKYVVLVAVLGAAVLGSLGPMILDPITIITRPLQEIVRPMMGADAVSHNAGAGLGRLAVREVAFLSLLPLAFALALNAIDRRFWCRSFCPLGGLLALISLSPGIRRQVKSEECTSCGKCSEACPTNAINREDGWTSNVTDCVVCMSCVDACPTHASRFPLKPSPEFVPPHNPERRDALVAMGATGAALGVAMLPKAIREKETILRPPATSEERLAELCVRCGACYATCPTGVLRPSISFTSVAGPWTPMLDERPAYCTRGCNKCATQCPTDAIHTPDEVEKVAWHVGQVAKVHEGMCQAWARGHECMKCQEACPIAGALKGIPRPSTAIVKSSKPVLVPVVDASLCIGCNLCSTKCPVHPPAIGVGTRNVGMGE